MDGERKELIRHRLKQAVKYCGIPQMELAAMIGTSQSQVSSWALGKSMPGLVVASRLCETLKINPAWLLGLRERREL